jgi:hypothetical protein
MGRCRLGPPRAQCTVIELDGRFSVYSSESHTVYTLNDSASAVWSLLDGTRTLDEVVACLAETYGTDPLELRTDVEQLVADFVEDRLLESHE